jgi:hypothetical protein
MARRIRGTNKNIQRVWREAEAAKTEAAKNVKAPSLRERLAGLFGGAK